MSPMGLLRSIADLLFVVWWGGLTFYAAVVVPVASEMIGPEMQGFVTQQVTHWLNGLGVVALLAVAPVTNFRSRWQLSCWCVCVMTLLALVALHPRLDELLDGPTMVVLDAERFYALHRWYLIGTTLQWFAGLFLLFRCLGAESGRR